MRRTQNPFALISILALLASLSLAQEPVKQNSKQTLAPAAGSNPVVGSGTPGQIVKWTGAPGISTNLIGDTNIFEDKFGKVGIGTKTPASPLTVQGMIETLLGGYKFPDGTVQATAGLADVLHDATLQGTGTGPAPLGVAVPLSLSGSSAIVVLSVTNSGDGDGVFGKSTNGDGVFGTSTKGAGVSGTSTLGYGVSGFSNGNIAVRGQSFTGEGVEGLSMSGDGVHGQSDSGVGVRGASNSIEGVLGEGPVGVRGIGNNPILGNGGEGVEATGGFAGSGDGGVGLGAIGGGASGAGKLSGDGLIAASGLVSNGAASGRAGTFLGDVSVTGKLTKAMGTFKIDHPLDPENKYLYHSFVESPDMMNIYNGNITTDQNGEAVVDMPAYFEALNKDFRYQLTVIGQFAQAIVASEMNDNRFVIKTNAPGVKVSWQVTGVRHDAYAEKNRVRVEEDKSEKERGHYLHPEVFNQSEERSVEWVRHPEMMQRLKQQQVEAAEKMKPPQRQ